MHPYLECLPFHSIDDDELSEDLIGDSNPNALGDSFMLNPSDDDSAFESPLAEIDPDVNFYNSSYLDSRYYDEENFCKMCDDNNVQSSYFSLFHMNIRSASKHSEELLIHLENLSHVFNVVALTETWLQDSNVDCINVPGYTHVYSCRDNRSGGGVSCLIKSGTSFNRRNDLEWNDDIAESIVLEINKCSVNSDRNIVIVTLYRPPGGDLSVFNEKLENLLSSISRENKMIYVMGDYNVNLLNADSHTKSAEFLQCMFSYGFLPMINRPTRITTTSATIIDNIFCRFDSEERISGILVSDISDYYPVFAICTSKKVQMQDSEYIYKRVYNPVNYQHFFSCLQNVEWSTVIASNECQCAYTKFHDLFQSCFEKSFPTKKIKVGYKTRRPWLNY